MRAATPTLAAIVLSLLAGPLALGRATQDQAAPFTSIAPERVAVDPSQGSSQGLQFLRADAKGRLYLLHGDTLEVDQLQPSGKLVARGKAPASRPADGSEVVTDAAISPDGDTWLLLSAPDRLALLAGDERRELPVSEWAVSALAYGVDGPVIAVLPAHVGGQDATAPLTKKVWDKPPFLLRLDDQKWQVLLAGKLLERGNEQALLLQDIKAERDTRVTTGRKGALWVAQQNAYVLKRYSRMGALEESLVVGGGRVEWKDRTEDDWKRLETAAQEGGVKLNRSKLAKVQAARVIRALTAQDSGVYLVVETPGGLALDRWDADTRTLDRLLLAGISPRPGALSLAAGRDGLYLAGARPGDPIWRLDWQKLDDAKWRPVPDAVTQGATPLPHRVAGEP